MVNLRQNWDTEVDVSEFTPYQQRALLDLFILALDADGQLPAANDARFDSLFKAMGVQYGRGTPAGV